ncbi:MAG TPA: histidine kinase [Terriglobales bacterium]|nr:histidine kinase [Terriglobales bacterium]
MGDEALFARAERPNWLRVWVALLVLWVTFMVLGTWFNHQALMARGHPISWAQAIRMNVVAYGIWAFLLTPLVVLCCAKIPLARRAWVGLGSAHLLAITAAVSIDVCTKTLLAGWAFPGAQSHPFLSQFHKYFFAEAEADIQIYLLIAVIGYVVAYYSALRGQERHAAELETTLVRTKLQVLKTQLQPHFLFNTLHSVAALVRTDPRAAEKMICSLGDLLRLTLGAEDTPKVPLKRELEFLRMYLDIQKVRFQDRLVADTRIEDDVLGCMVPYLLLQPLVENAIKHGVARIRGRRTIEICIRRNSDQLSMTVVNDSSSASLVPEEDRLGIGLENIRSRLHMLYGSRGSLAAQEVSNGRFKVEVRIPFETERVSEEEDVPVAPVLWQESEVGL